MPWASQASCVFKRLFASEQALAAAKGVCVQFRQLSPVVALPFGRSLQQVILPSSKADVRQQVSAVRLYQTAWLAKINQLLVEELLCSTS